MKKVYITNDPADAHLLKGLLEGEGIDAEVRGEILYRFVITEDTSPSVWVDDSNFDRALELVSTFHEGSSQIQEAKSWKCSCGEENESQFTECWNCGKGRSLR